MSEIKNILLIDENFSPLLTEEQCRNLQPIFGEFFREAILSPNVAPEVWLKKVISKNLGDSKSEEEINSIVTSIIDTLRAQEETKSSMEASIKNGRSVEDWFARKVTESVSSSASAEVVSYLQGLDNAIAQANGALYQTITTQSGEISQNPCLDGFIAEQHHAQTFNTNAQAVGSPYRAKVLEPNGTAYNKNSVDVVVYDQKKPTEYVARYQSKYCKDADATLQAFDNGDYRGQQKLVPEDQVVDLQAKNIKVTSTIVAPDGTMSNPLTKVRAQEMRKEAQSGNWQELNWNEYRTKDLARGIANRAGYAALMGSVIGVTLDVASKLHKGQEIKLEDEFCVALKSGADFGIKAAAAGALKVGVEKGIVPCLKKGISSNTCANIAFVAIENAKTVAKIGKGELTVVEGLKAMERTTCSMVAGLACSSKGGAIGATIGAILGPAGAAIGGFIGSTVGYIAGSKMGDHVCEGFQKVRSKVWDGIKSEAKSVGNAISNGVESFCHGLARVFA